MYATKIKMKPGCRYSQDLMEIDEIFIEGCQTPGFYKKANVHDFVKNNPRTLFVKIPPYPEVLPATSMYGEKYVRSSPNSTLRDNLLSLPRE